MRGAEYGLPYAEPFTVLTLRLALAGVLLGLLAAVTGGGAPRGGRQVAEAALVGLLFGEALPPLSLVGVAAATAGLALVPRPSGDTRPGGRARTGRAEEG